MSEPNKTDNTPVNTAENGIIIATIEASICFMELVRIVQHRADVMRVNKITNNMCKGLNEKKIFSWVHEGQTIQEIKDKGGYF